MVVMAWLRSPSAFFSCHHLIQFHLNITSNICRYSLSLGCGFSCFVLGILHARSSEHLPDLRHFKAFFLSSSFLSFSFSFSFFLFSLFPFSLFSLFLLFSVFPFFPLFLFPHFPFFPFSHFPFFPFPPFSLFPFSLLFPFFPFSLLSPFPFSSPFPFFSLSSSFPIYLVSINNLCCAGFRQRIVAYFPKKSQLLFLKLQLQF